MTKRTRFKKPKQKILRADIRIKIETNPQPYKQDLFVGKYENVCALYCIAEQSAFYKIGYTSNPSERLKSLQQGNPRQLKIVYLVYVCVDPEKMEALEQHLHKYLRSNIHTTKQTGFKHQHGEWYTFHHPKTAISMIWECVSKNAIKYFVTEYKTEWIHKTEKYKYIGTPHPHNNQKIIQILDDKAKHH